MGVRPKTSTDDVIAAFRESSCGSLSARAPSSCGSDGEGGEKDSGGHGSVASDIDEALVQETAQATDFRRGTRFKKLARMLGSKVVRF